MWKLIHSLIDCIAPAESSKRVAIDNNFSRTQGHRNTIMPCDRTHKHTRTFHVSSMAAATNLHIDTPHPPPQPPHYPTVLITSERLQKVGANNKATYYI